MFEWLKNHILPIFSSGMVFGIGGVYAVHKQHGKDIDEIKSKQNQYSEDIGEIKGILQRLDERTKHLRKHD